MKSKIQKPGKIADLGEMNVPVGVGGRVASGKFNRQKDLGIDVSGQGALPSGQGSQALDIYRDGFGAADSEDDGSDGGLGEYQYEQDFEQEEQENDQEEQDADQMDHEDPEEEYTEEVSAIQNEGDPQYYDQDQLYQKQAAMEQNNKNRPTPGSDPNGDMIKITQENNSKEQIKSYERQLNDPNMVKTYANEDFYDDQMQEGQDDQFDETDGFIPVVGKKKAARDESPPAIAGGKSSQKEFESRDVAKKREVPDSKDPEKPELTHSPPQNNKGKLRKADLLNEAQKSKEGIMNQISQKEIKLKAHERKIGQYILGKTIGEGTFGKVKIGLHILTKAKVAVKILEKSKINDVADVERVSREIHILKIVQHPHVVQLYEIIETPKKLYLIMEYASGGELFDYIVKHQRVQEKEACLFFQQLLSGIEYTSKLNVVHRDLKPENLLLDYDKGVKIVDFGLSNTYKDGELLKTACGSPCYAAPEMIAGKKYNGTNVDIWSCGVILFALICGYLPFEDPNTSNLYKKILNADFQTPNYVSDEAKDLFHQILNTDPAKRYTIDQIREHRWFNLVKCEANYKGVLVGIDPIPVDTAILDGMQVDYGIDKSYARKCIQSNKHNHISASYYLLLKDLIKRGEKSVADVRSPDYNPKLFVQTAKTVKQEKMRERLENTSMQQEDQTEELNSETQSPKDSGVIRKPKKVADDLAIMKTETEENSKKEDVDKEDVDKEDEPRIQSSSGKKANPRNKSTQPQKLRKIADGLLEFERYADRKKRLQNIQMREDNQERIRNMNLEVSKNQIADDLLSNGGGLSLLRRGLSPVAGAGPEGQTIPGHDTLSFDGDPNMLFSQGRDQSPSLSPHSLRMNAQRGMQTKYGNFLYQVDAKQFPGSQMANGKQPQGNTEEQFQLNALKNQLHIQALQQQMNNQNAMMNYQPVNAKQMQKQLKQLYIHQKKGSNKNGANQQNNQPHNQEIVLKNMVNLGPQQNSNSQIAHIQKIQRLQQNYQNKFNPKKNVTQQNFSTIQTAYDTVQNQQTLMMNTNTLGFNNSAVSGKSKKGAPGMPSVHQTAQSLVPVQYNNFASNVGGNMDQMMQNNVQGQGQANSSATGMGPPGGAGGSGHQRFPTANFAANPNFNTIQQHMLNTNGMAPNIKLNNNSAVGYAQQMYNNGRNQIQNPQNSFINNVTHNGSALGINAGNVSQKSKRKKNATVTGSGSLGPGGGIFSPKNLPINSFGFGYGVQNKYQNNLSTPQNQVQRSFGGQVNQPHALFTLDGQAGNNNLVSIQDGQQANLSNQLMNSLQTMGQQEQYEQYSQQQYEYEQNPNVVASLNVQKTNKQNSLPLAPAINSKGRQSNIVNPRGSSITVSQQQAQQANTITYTGENSSNINQSQPLQSQNSNKALFKRKRENNRATKNSNKTAQKYAQYGTIQQNETAGVKKTSSKNNISINNSNKPPLVNQNAEANPNAKKSQKKIPKQQRVNNSKSINAAKNMNQSLQASASSTKNNTNISMKRIIETGQNLVNLNLNVNLSGMTAQTTKNANLFSPIAGASQPAEPNSALPGTPLTPTQQQQLRIFQQQKLQQDHLENLNKIQQQLKIKQQQKANLQKGMEPKKQPGKNNQNQYADSIVNNSFTGGSNSIGLPAQSPQFASQFGSPSNALAQKKITLNSSLLAQNYAPHLLLQNFHGNGYPPPLQPGKALGPQFKTPSNQYVNSLMSPTNTTFTSVSPNAAYAQTQGLAMKQSSQQNNPSLKAQHSRQKTPQLSIQQQKLLSPGGGQANPPMKPSQLSNLTNIQLSQHNDTTPLAAIASPGGIKNANNPNLGVPPQTFTQPAATYTNALWMKQLQQAQNGNQGKNEDKKGKKPQSFPISPTNHQSQQSRQVPNPMNGSGQKQAFGRQSNSIAHNAGTGMDKSDMAQNTFNNGAANSSALKYGLPGLDSSNIDYLEDADISNNTIANINQQLSDDAVQRPTGGSALNQNQTGHAMAESTKKRQTRRAKKKSISHQ